MLPGNRTKNLAFLLAENMFYPVRHPERSFDIAGCYNRFDINDGAFVHCIKSLDMKPSTGCYFEWNVGALMTKHKKKL
jgi:hypothetical protein